MVFEFQSSSSEDDVTARHRQFYRDRCQRVGHLATWLEHHGTKDAHYFSDLQYECVLKLFSPLYTLRVELPNDRDLKHIIDEFTRKPIPLVEALKGDLQQGTVNFK